MYQHCGEMGWKKVGKFQYFGVFWLFEPETSKYDHSIIKYNIAVVPAILPNFTIIYQLSYKCAAKNYDDSTMQMHEKLY